jgi:hypothetical protein
MTFFDNHFGPNVVMLATAFGLTHFEQRAIYAMLPVVPDPDDLVNAKDTVPGHTRFNRMHTLPANCGPISQMDCYVDHAGSLCFLPNSLHC